MRRGVAVIGAALVLAVLGDALFQGQPLGLNVALWAAAFTVSVAVLLRVTRAPLHQGRRFMLAPLLLFASLFVWHDSPLVVAANLLAIAAALSVGALRDVRDATLTEYGEGFVGAASSTLVGAAPLLMTDIRWSDLAGRARSEKLTAVARGFALGLPLLAVFGALFVAADAVFKHLVTSAVPTPDASVAERVVIVAVWAWLAGGLLRDLLRARERSEEVPSVRRRILGPLEIGIALAVLDLLFLAFVVVQFRYLFGGSALVQSEAHLTYAEYARHGFFELVAVTALTLPVLLLADWALGDRGRRAFRWLAAALLVLLGVVIASALERMRLYVQHFGLTELRLYATGVILWLAAVSAWFAVTVLRGRRHAFAVGALVAGFVATFALNVLNPDALIARTNVTRPAVDVSYLAHLSDDAVPTLVSRIRSLPAPQRAVLAQALLTRGASSGDWRSWNLSRARADEALSRHRAELAVLARALGSRP
jgi:ACR3 family arsenite efflux pump ArsB